MKLTFNMLLIAVLCLSTNGCTSLISASQGDEPIVDDPGSRTWGTVIDDQSITTKVKVNLDKGGKALQNSHINVTSFNGIVLLTGETTSANTKAKASQITRKIRKVRKVYNELTVSGTTSLIARTNDSWLKTKIKSKVLADQDVSFNRIKVVVENGVVFLMGLVSRAEADKAVSLISDVGGLQKIVRVFEYIE